MNATIPERKPATEEISGLIERLTFHNEENGFCVLRVKPCPPRESARKCIYEVVRSSHGTRGEHSAISTESTK